MNQNTNSKKILSSQFIKDLNFRYIYKPEVDTYINSGDINRIGLQLAGFFDNFDYKRVQILGNTEYLYSKSLSKEDRTKTIDRLFSFDIPILIISDKYEILPEILESAKKYSRIIVSSKEKTTKTIYRVTNYLNENLAPEISIHGVLVDVDGVGILITGESGVGKSETALELIKRNHRLVADDAVRIIKIDEDTLQGSCVETIEHFMEIRGLGIIDVKSLYGVGAVKKTKKIDMVVNLENWQEGKYYDRLGLDQEYIEILDTKIEKLTIPIRPGRNIGIIIELAARNHRQKSMGYNAAVEFNNKLLASLEKNRNKNLKK